MILRFFLLGSIGLLLSSCTVSTPFIYSPTIALSPGISLNTDSSFTIQVVDNRVDKLFLGYVYSSNGIASNKVIPKNINITPPIEKAIENELVTLGLTKFEGTGKAAFSILIVISGLYAEVRPGFAKSTATGMAWVSVEISSSRSSDKIYSKNFTGKAKETARLIGREAVALIINRALDNAFYEWMSDYTFTKAMVKK